MASASIPARATECSPWETIVAVAAVVSLVLWPVEIHTAFGLPAHPLIIDVPVIFVPVLGLATLALLALRALAMLFVLVAILFVIRAGHLGSKLAWNQPPGQPPLTKSTIRLIMSSSG
jgi:uncharacterized protein YneF (UPF0154 family)